MDFSGLFHSIMYVLGCINSIAIGFFKEMERLEGMK